MSNINLTYMLLILMIIVVCAILGSIKNIDHFDDSYRAYDFIIERQLILKNLPNTVANRNTIDSQIRAMMLIPPVEFFTRQGIDFTAMPETTRAQLKEINLYDILSNFKRNVVVNSEGRNVYLDQCIIPIEFVAKVRSKGNTDSIKLEKSLDSNSFQICKIGTLTFPTNISNTFDSDMNKYLEGTIDPSNANFKTYGCIYNFTTLEQLKKDLEVIYVLQEKETIVRMKNLVEEYKRTTELVRQASQRRANAEAEKARQFGILQGIIREKDAKFTELNTEKVTTKNVQDQLTSTETNNRRLEASYLNQIAKTSIMNIN